MASPTGLHSFAGRVLTSIGRPSRTLCSYHKCSSARLSRARHFFVTEASSGDVQTPASVAMGSAQQQVAALFKEALAKVVPEGEAPEPIVLPTQNPKFGDYQCNNALPLLKKLPKGTYKNPREVAQAIIDALPESELIKEVSIAGPGFINTTLSRDWAALQLKSLLREGTDSWKPNTPHETVIVDFSSPNIAKEMHVGHLRSTIIGDTLCRIFEFCGQNVVRLNHVGDWGTQFGMLIEYMADHSPELLEAEGDVDTAPISDLQAFYKKAKVKFDEDADFKERSQLRVVALQGGDEKTRAAWQRICEVSRKEFQAIYDRLHVVIEERGESFYNPLIPGVLEKLGEAGLTEISDGAECIFPEVRKEGQPPLIVRKSDGGFNYASTDLAAVYHRVFTLGAKRVIYVTDAGQQTHFHAVFDAARRAGWLADGAKLEHCGFGLVLGEDGKRFRTRSTEVVRLVDLLDEAKSKCVEQLQERGREDLDEEAMQNAGAAMGYGAVKYADLRQNRTTNYTFSFERMLDLKGNTAVYLLYAYARIKSIKDKVDIPLEAEDIKLEHEKEWALANHILKFPEVVEACASELAPNKLCEYLYNLSTIYNEFYTECKVIGSEYEASRLQLCDCTLRIMKACFDMLGITPLDRI